MKGMDIIMKDEVILKSAVFGGFKREDVLDYIESIQNEKVKATEEVKALSAFLANTLDDFKEIKQQLAELEEENRQLEAKLRSLGHEPEDIVLSDSASVPRKEPDAKQEDEMTQTAEDIKAEDDTSKPISEKEIISDDIVTEDSDSEEDASDEADPEEVVSDEVTLEDIVSDDKSADRFGGFVDDLSRFIEEQKKPKKTDEPFCEIKETVTEVKTLADAAKTVADAEAEDINDSEYSPTDILKMIDKYAGLSGQ